MTRIWSGIVLGGLAGALIAAGTVAPGGASIAGAAETPVANPLSGNEAAIREGRSWYLAVCGPCHGGRADGSGERGQGANLRVFKGGFRKFVDTVKNGRDVPGRTMKMPPWGGVLKDDQIYQIGAYLETLAEPGASWAEPAN
jgi:mono/diheme cytochrome c family protein